jgi:STE24 endopeptidase
VTIRHELKPAIAQGRLPGGRLPWLLATAFVVVAGVGAVLVRPLAPDLGVPPPAGRWFGPDLLARIAAYRAPLRGAVVAGLLLEVTVPVLVAVTPAGRRLAAALVTRAGDGRPVRAATAVAAMIVVLGAVVHLPLGLWAHLHARAFGLTAQPLAGWAGDRAIEVGVATVATAIVVATTYAVLGRWPRHWVLLAAPVGLLLVTVATVAMPLVVEPLRFDVVPLRDGAVRDALEPVLDAAGEPDATVVVADASRRTVRQNAYVAGLWGSRRIVLYDTLLERSPSQVALVVAHELAHQRNRDIARGVLAAAAGLTAVAAVVAAVLRWRVRTGRQATVGDPHGAAAVVATAVVVLALSAPIAAWASRRVEAAADLGSLRLSGAVADYCATHRGLVERNLSDPAPPTWERLWWWSHPPATARLALAERVAPDAAC